MKNKKLIIWLSILIIIIIVVGLLLRANKQELIFNTTPVKKGTVEITVMATGYIQPVEEIEVGTQVSGVIEKIYVDYNSPVRAGQLLAELDKSTLEEKLVQANASQASAQSDLLYAEQNYNRIKALHEIKAATEVSLEEAVNRLAQAKSSLENAKANASQAKVNRDYAYIYSPINGVILNRSVNVGQTVASSFNTPTLFTIAEDLTKMQVEVDVDEADIGQIRVGQKAIFTVDAYSNEQFEGTVQQIRLQPTVTNNVVTYTVIVEAPNPEEKLFPGMTASITIKIESETALTIPMEALNFKMTPMIAGHINPGQQEETHKPAMSSMPLSDNKQSVNTHSVWVKSEQWIEQRQIRTSINDGVNIIVESGLKNGEEVILSTIVSKKSNNGNAAQNPLMPKPPR